MKKESLTYLKHLENVHFKDSEVELEKIDLIVSSMEMLSRAFYCHAPSFFILDYTQRGYLKLSNYDSLSLGYTSQDFLDGGLDFVLDIYQKDDFECVNKNVFNQVSKFLESQPQADHENYVFTHNYRWKKRDGNFATIMQRRSFVTSRQTGLPLISYGLCMDITPMKMDTRMVHIIDKMKREGEEVKLENIRTDFYYPIPDEAILTKREREILCWVADGLSTKQLADKLFIAENTIANHRKNILRKTNSKNVAQLIKYSIRNGII